MKRIISTLIVLTFVLMPSLGQENADRLSQLEQLEELPSKTTPPDTLVLEEEYATDMAADIQAPDTMDYDNEDFDNEDFDNNSTVRIGKNIIVEETDDSVIIRVGEKEIVINEDGNDTSVDFRNYRKERRSRQFQGHLGGIEFGYNNYLEDFWSTSLEPAHSYLDLHSAKSTCFNIYSPNVSLGFTRHFGLVSAFGINFNNYRFDNNNSVTTDDDGMLVPLYPGAGIEFEKSKLSTVYAVLPVILEAQIPVSGGSSINIGAGVIGAVKLGSHTKVQYYDSGKQKDKEKGDFSLNMLRYGVTARLGYEMIQAYGTCYLSQLFEKGKGPEVYPFEVGIALTIND